MPVLVVPGTTARRRITSVPPQAAATLEDGVITGTAVTQFEMPDFGITPPKVGPVLGLSETVQLEAEIVAKTTE